MQIDLNDLNAFVAVARAKGFREGARLSGSSASRLSESVRRLETELGVRLLHRTTRSVVPTEAGQRLLERLGLAWNVQTPANLPRRTGITPLTGAARDVLQQVPRGLPAQ